MRVFRYPSADSTNECAFRALARGEAQHGDAHVALEQTAGRGRRGAAWHSPTGAGLYMSVCLLPQQPLSGAGLTMAAGLAAWDAVRACGCGVCRLKWPNDVVDAQGAKLAGVIIETRGLDPRAPHYVVGVGIDVLQREFPAALVQERPVTSLRLLGVETTLSAVESALLEALPRRVAQLEHAAHTVCADFLDALALRSAYVAARGADSEVRGRLQGLDLDQGLILVDSHGHTRHMALETVQALVTVAPHDTL